MKGSQNVLHKIQGLLFMKQIGKGAFGDVYLAKKENNPSEIYAVKVIKLSILNQDEEIKRHFDYEMSILKRLDHENLITLYEIKQTKTHYYLLMNYCNGGDLDHILTKYKLLHNNKPFSQEIVQHLMKQILNGIDYLHNTLHIIHRDLKLDNILINFKNEKDLEKLDLLKADLKICDFGTAKSLESGTLASTVVGTPYNMAPQLVQQFAKIAKGKEASEDFMYDYKADIYSLGTVCYHMIFGCRPFEAKSGEELYINQVKCKFNFPENFEKLDVSVDIVDFILKMVAFEPKDRLGVDELLLQSFITKKVSELRPYVQSMDQAVYNDSKYSGYHRDNSISVYDNLNLWPSEKIKSLVNNDFIYFSGEFNKYNSHRFKITRNVIITGNNFYHFDGEKRNSFYEIKNIKGISLSVSKEMCQFVVHLIKDYDHFFFTKSKETMYQLFEVLGKLYKKKVGQSLKVFKVDENNIENCITTKKDREKDENASNMPETEELLSMDELSDTLLKTNID